MEKHKYFKKKLSVCSGKARHEPHMKNGRISQGNEKFTIRRKAATLLDLFYGQRKALPFGRNL